MIFKVILNGSRVIYDGNNPTGILDPQLEIELNAAGSFTFILPSGSDVINDITPFTSEIDVYEDDEMIWFGRVLNKEKVWNNQCRITCEGGLAYFNDSIQDKKTWESTRVENQEGVTSDGDVTMAMFFRDLIDWHNDQVSSERQWEVGTIAPEFGLSKIWRETNRETTSDCLQTMCLDTDGGYFITRKEYVIDPTEGRIAKRYIDWVNEMPYSSTQNIEFGVNLLDVSNSINGADICTSLVPIGADELTIYNVPDTGSKESPVDGCYHKKKTYTVIHVASEAVYGRIQKTKTWSDITDKESLYLKAVEYLKEQNTDIPSIECSAAELHYLDGHHGETAFRVGQLVRVVSPVHGIIGNYPLLKISMSLNSGAKRVTIGTPPKKELTDIVKNTSGTSSRNTTGGSTGSGSGGSSGGSGYVGVKDVRLKKPGDVEYESTVKNKVSKIDLSNMVKDVKINGVSVVTEGQALLPAYPTIPVEDVLYGGSSLVVNKKAIIPPYPTIPVRDVLQGGSSLVVNGLAIIPESTKVLANVQEEASTKLKNLKIDNDLYDANSINTFYEVNDPSDEVGQQGDLYLKCSVEPNSNLVTNIICDFKAPNEKWNAYLSVNNFSFYKTDNTTKAAWPSGTTLSLNEGSTVGRNSSVNNFIKNGDTYFYRQNVAGDIIITINLPEGQTINLAEYPIMWFKCYQTWANSPSGWTIKASVDGGLTYRNIDVHSDPLPQWSGNGYWYNKQVYDVIDAFRSVEKLFFKTNRWLEYMTGLVHLATIYSTVEQEIGVASDNRPLYQRSFTFTDLTANTVINLGPVHTDFLHSESLRGMYTIESEDDSFLEVEPNYDDSVNEFGYRLWLNGGNMYTAFYPNDLVYISSKLLVTVQYTKSTDDPGDGRLFSEGALYATEAVLRKTLEDATSNFQAGVDGIYDICDAKGSTPGDKSLRSVEVAIMNIETADGMTLNPFKISDAEESVTSYFDLTYANGSQFDISYYHGISWSKSSIEESLIPFDNTNFIGGFGWYNGNRLTNLQSFKDFVDYSYNNSVGFYVRNLSKIASQDDTSNYLSIFFKPKNNKSFYLTSVVIIPYYDDANSIGYFDTYDVTKSLIYSLDLNKQIGRPTYNMWSGLGYECHPYGQDLITINLTPTFVSEGIEIVLRDPPKNSEMCNRYDYCGIRRIILYGWFSDL